MKTSEAISLKKEEQNKLNRKTNAMKQKIKSGSIKIKEMMKKKREKRGVIYLGHIPHGFYEEEMRAYFTQFGVVTNVRVCRSGGTGRSKGYGYVEFLEPEVAKIAAETMNNYIMFKRRLVAEYIPPEKRPPYLFSKKQNTLEDYAALKKMKRMLIEKNKNVDDQTHLKRSKRTLQKLIKKIDVFKRYGIEYDLQPVDVPVKLENNKLNKREALKEEYVNDSFDSEVEFNVKKLAKPKMVLRKRRDGEKGGVKIIK